MPLFSIVIPTHNRANVILRAIESVQAQNYPNWEIIVIDNCSTDDTKKVIEEISSLDKRVNYYYINKKGVSIARNFGISKATGDYICFLDDDDEYLDSYLSLLYKEILKNNNKPAFYRTFAIDKYQEQYKEHLIRCQEPYTNNLHYLLENVVYVNNVCLHKSTLVDFKFDETLELAEDYHLWLRIVAKYPIICIPAHTSICYKSSSTASAGSVLTYTNYIQSYKKIFAEELIHKNCSNSYFRGLIARNYLWLMIAYASEKKLHGVLSSYFNHVIWSKNISNFKSFVSQLKLVFTNR